MKRTFMWLLLLVFNLHLLVAFESGISIGVFDANLTSESFDRGTHVQIGAIRGLSQNLEGEVFAIVKATEIPGEQVYAGGGVSLALLSPVYAKEGANVPSYSNAYVSAGFLLDALGASSYGPYIRITPISVGGPQFKLRERTLTFGLYWDVPKNAISLFWNLFSLDFFFSGSKNH
ncbi:MAG: hypothetical protein ACOXZ4_01670 [Sphaerochaetaceae bacterium]